MMVDYNGTLPARTKANPASKGSDARPTSNSSESKAPRNGDDDVFSDSDEEEIKGTQSREASSEYKFMTPHQASEATTDHVGVLTHTTGQLSLQHEERTQNNASEESTTDKIHAVPSATNMESVGASEIKAIAADASVFSFGDEDFESD